MSLRVPRRRHSHQLAMHRCARAPRPALRAPCKNPISMGDGTEPLFGEPQVDDQCAQSPGVLQLRASLHSEVSEQCGTHQPQRKVQQQARREASVKMQGARALGDTHSFPEQRVQGDGDTEGCTETLCHRWPSKTEIPGDRRIECQPFTLGSGECASPWICCFCRRLHLSGLTCRLLSGFTCRLLSGFTCRLLSGFT
jgi:hypothetical protein